MSEEADAAGAAAGGEEACVPLSKLDVVGGLVVETLCPKAAEDADTAGAAVCPKAAEAKGVIGGRMFLPEWALLTTIGFKSLGGGERVATGLADIVPKGLKS